MKKAVRQIEKVFMLTLGLPFLLAMALGYWSHSDDDVTYFEALKRCLD